MIIVVGGMIGAGKTSYAKMISDKLGSKVFYENVEGNDILPLFYTASEEEQNAKRYPFLLQLEFLNSRYQDIKAAFHERDNVLDRSIYEDWYFCKVNNELGRISDLEFKVYEKLLDNMMQELTELPQKAPDLMVYLHGSFETILHRIGMRGRDFEQDASLRDYYYALWKGYDNWVYTQYSASQVLSINIDEYDIINRPEDQEKVMRLIQTKFAQMKQEGILN